MIYAVTLNPCLDKTLTVPDWKPGDSVRGRALSAVVGGKGNNVARTLRRLGRDVRPVTFLGGSIGGVCDTMLRTVDGLDPLVTRTVSETRVILTVRTSPSNEQTAFFDPDPEISADEARQLSRTVEDAIDSLEINALTLSGSSPSESTHALYAELVASARRAGVPVFLDTYGPALARVETTWPTSIQMNLREAGIFLKKPQTDAEDCLRLLEFWTDRGVEHAAITNGPDTAFVACRGVKYKVTPPRIEAVNPIGSGDAMLAGLVHAWLSGRDPEGLIRQAFGSAVANAMVWEAGAVDPIEAARQGGRVQIEPIAD